MTHSYATHRAMEAHEILLPGAMTLLFGFGAGSSPQPTAASEAEASATAGVLADVSSPQPAVAVVETSVGAPQSDTADVSVPHPAAAGVDDASLDAAAAVESESPHPPPEVEAG